jgi:hypothetical protein
MFRKQSVVLTIGPKASHECIVEKSTNESEETDFGTIFRTSKGFKSKQNFYNSFSIEQGRLKTM